MSTYQREADRRFSVQFLLQDISKLGESKQMALKQFYTLEEKLTNNKYGFEVSICEVHARVPSFGTSD